MSQRRSPILSPSSRCAPLRGMDCYRIEFWFAGRLMANVLQDIDVSDAYGRSKRASLLYSAALIVLAFVIPSGVAAGVSVLGASVSLNIARGLTWAAALYYTVSFCLEWRIARILNSKAMANEFAGGVNARFQELADRFKRYSERIAETSDAYIDAMKGVTANIERFTSQVLEQDAAAKKERIPRISGTGPEQFVSEMKASNEEMQEIFFLRLDSASRERFDSLKMTVQNDVSIVKGAADQNLAVYSVISEALNKLAVDFNVLASRFNAEQKFIFYGMDLGAVALLFLAGTVLSVAAILGFL
jgi:hypothetical protein